MKRLIEQSRDTLADARDSVCLERARLVTEIYAPYEHLPNPLLRAKAFAHVLENMTLDLRTNPIFAGNMSSKPRAWMLLPEYGFITPTQSGIEDPGLTGFLDGDAVPADLRAFWKTRSMNRHAGIGHLAVNLERLLTQGLEGVLAEIEEHADEPDQEKADFREACAISCRALIRWAQRYAEEAGRLARAERDEMRRLALLRVASACRHVPEKPARNLFEALQSIALVQLAIHIEGHGYSVSIGGLDRILLPYYDAVPDTVDLISAFLLKLHENAMWGSHSTTQCITIGGVDRAGRDGCNPLTQAFLQAYERVRVTDPHVFLRWHENIDRAVKRQAVGMLLNGMSMPMLIADEPTVAGFVRAGIREEDAWNYCVIGCNELGIPGKLRWHSVMGVCGVGLLNQALLEAASNGGLHSLGEVWDALKQRTAAYIENRAGAAHNMRATLLAKGQTPFTSALMDGCIARGRDLHDAMEYDRAFTLELGFTNLVNSLAAIDSVVFRDRAADMAELTAALKADFEGYEPLRVRLSNAPKWGNDDERADTWAAKWCAARGELLARAGERSGLGPILSSHVTRTLHHKHGAGLGASPDGRHAGAPLADSIGAQRGTAFGGPTALLNSVSKLDPPRFWPGGYNLNLALSRTALPGDREAALVQNLVEAFFANGGQELQINCLDARMLRAAKRDPHAHRDLVVRVAGFNALFVRLSDTLQDELIARAERAQ
ncbi:MAG: hypothetical protein JXR37_11610 [Kiritimatiellae bacterium]|nr:hypothetical protein [Kiritimatiellia bacterium]